MARFKSLWTRKSRGKRPVLDVPRTPFELALELVAAAGLVLVFVVLAQAWPGLPDRVPQHFEANGLPNAWGGRDVLWLFPGVATGLSLMLTIANRFPHTFNYPWPITEQNAETQYVLARALLAALKAEFVLLVAFLEWETIEVALGRSTGLSVAFLPVFLGVIVLTTGLYFIRAYQAR